jgi:hypothetical protein
MCAHASSGWQARLLLTHADHCTPGLLSGAPYHCLRISRSSRLQLQARPDHATGGARGAAGWEPHQPAQGSPVTPAVSGVVKGVSAVGVGEGLARVSFTTAAGNQGERRTACFWGRGVQLQLQLQGPCTCQLSGGPTRAQQAVRRQPSKPIMPACCLGMRGLHRCGCRRCWGMPAPTWGGGGHLSCVRRRVCRGGLGGGGSPASRQAGRQVTG